MSIKTSTGLAAKLMVTNSMKGIFEGGVLKVFSGSEPATADAAETGTLLWSVTKDGGGVPPGGSGTTFEATAGGTDGRALVKKTADTWSGATVAGTCGYWRLVAAADGGSSSTTDARVQGNVGSTVGADLFMTNPVLGTDADPGAKVLASFSVTLPTF